MVDPVPVVVLIVMVVVAVVELEAGIEVLFAANAVVVQVRFVVVPRRPASPWHIAFDPLLPIPHTAKVDSGAEGYARTHAPRRSQTKSGGYDLLLVWGHLFPDN